MQKKIFDGKHGEVPRDFLYGYYHYKSPKNHLIVPRGIRKKLYEKFFYHGFEKHFARFTKLGFPLDFYFQNQATLKNASLIFTITDALSFSVLLFKKLGLIHGKVIVLFQSLSERQKSFIQRSLFIRLLRPLLKQADLVLTLSDIAKKPLEQAFLVPTTKLHTFYFGVDTEFWVPSNGLDTHNQNFLFSVGNDLNRDFKTLISALPKDKTLQIVTRSTLNFDGKKVIQHIYISDLELRKLYQQSAVTVIPSIQVEYESSGLSCILQSMACGTPVLTSDAPVLRETFTNGEDILFYKPQDSHDLNEKIPQLLNDESLRNKISQNALKKVRDKFDIKHMSARLEELVGLL